MIRPALKSVFIIASLCLIVSCGSRGELKKAPPMWGDAKAKYEAEQAKKAAEEKAKESENQQ